MLSPLIDERGDQGRPAGLMRCAQAGAGVAVEILVKENQIVPVGIVLELALVAVKGAAAGRLIAREDPDQPLGQRSAPFRRT